MVNFIYSMVVIAFQEICSDILFSSFSVKRYKSKFINIVIYALLAVSFFIVANTDYIRNNMFLKIIIVILLYSLAVYTLYRNSVVKSIVLSTLFETLACVCDFFVLFIFTQILGNLTGIVDDLDPVGSAIVVSSSSLLFIIVIIARSVFYRKNAEVMSVKEWVKFMACPLITMCILCSIMVGSGGIKGIQSDNVNLIILMGLIFINVSQYYMLNDTLVSQAKIREDDRMRTEMESQIRLYESISDNYEKQKKIAHEYKNHLQCINTLAVKKQYDELKDYVGKLCKKQDSVMYAINTNNPIINAVVNTKYQEAVDNEILLSFLVDDLSDLKVDDEDMVVILSNLLNNALEACKKCDERIIRLKIISEDGDILISVENNCNVTVTSNKGSFMTTKTDNPEEHGIGIKNVINLVEKYNGTYTIKSDDKKFVFSIVIPKGY